MRRLALIALLVGALLFLANRSTAQSLNEPWLAYPDNRSEWTKSASLPNTEWSEVLIERVAEAVDQLQNASFIEISRERARELTGLRLSEAMAPRLFLVRGVEFGDGGSVFRVLRLDRDIWVTSGILSNQHLPLRRRPFVVALSDAPRKIYISASIAQ